MVVDNPRRQEAIGARYEDGGFGGVLNYGHKSSSLVARCEKEAEKEAIALAYPGRTTLLLYLPNSNSASTTRKRDSKARNIL